MFLRRFITWLFAMLVPLLVAFVFATEASAKVHKSHKPPKYLNSPHCQKHQRGLIGVTHSEKAFNFFLRKGLTPNQSAGLVGNLLQENSGMLPKEINYKGALGIGQWLYGRKSGLFSFASSKQESPYELKTQLQYIWYEFMHTETGAYSELKSSTTLYGATIAVRAYYERPSLWEANDPRRYSLAEGVLSLAKSVNFCGRWKYHAPAPHPKQSTRPVKSHKKHKPTNFAVELLAHGGETFKIAVLKTLNTAEAKLINAAETSFRKSIANKYIKLTALITFLMIVARIRLSLRRQPEET